MNVASWVIFAALIVWIGFVIRSIFFGKQTCCGSSRCNTDNKHVADKDTTDDDVDDDYKLPHACAGCSNRSCVGCSVASKKYDIPMPTIREGK